MKSNIIFSAENGYSKSCFKKSSQAVLVAVLFFYPEVRKGDDADILREIICTIK
jgi:hypothetical protein